MRYLFTFGYWVVAVVLLATVLVSFGYNFGRAMFLATAMLPGMFCAKIFLPMAMQESKRRVFAVGCVVVGIVIVEWMALLVANSSMRSEWDYASELPSQLSNPVLIVILLAAIVIPEELISRYLKRKFPRDNTLSFISDRRKVTLALSDVLYVESCDSEVLVHCVDGGVYRTKTRISQWEQLLDGRFVRIHRAYIVNEDYVTGFSATKIAVRDQHLDVSRKYKESVASRFGAGEKAVPMLHDEA